MKLSAQVDATQFKNEMYDVINEALKEVMEDRKQENELPILLTKRQMAEHLFNTTYQNLDNHAITYKPGFPYFELGNRTLYPRDEVIAWIAGNIEYVQNFKVRVSAV